MALSSGAQHVIYSVPACPEAGYAASTELEIIWRVYLQIFRAYGAKDGVVACIVRRSFGSY
jgi:hypothetical protein